MPQKTRLKLAAQNIAILGGADLSDANLQEMTWGKKQQWEDVRGLETAVNVPEALKEELGLN